MARRYRPSRGRRRRNNKRRYVVSAAAVFLLLFMYVLGIWPFGSSESPEGAQAQQSESSAQQRAQRQPRSQPVNEPAAEPVVTQQPRQQLEEITEPVSEQLVEAVPEPSQPEPQPSREPTRRADADNSRIESIIEDVDALLVADPRAVIDARDMLNEALQMQMSSRQRERIVERMSALADQWLFSSTIYPDDELTSRYHVQPGDLLQNIGRRFNTPFEILLEINDIIRPESLRAGQHIKVVNGPFHCRVDRTNFTLDLYLQDTFVRRFHVGLGKDGMETPTGLWIVELGGRLIRPRWTDPVTRRTYEASDPDYPLGARWIALKGIEGNAVGREGFAIHGTNEPETVGTRSSQGCIRLEDSEVILLYNMLMPGHSEVEVFDS